VALFKLAMTLVVASAARDVTLWQGGVDAVLRPPHCWHGCVSIVGSSNGADWDLCYEERRGVIDDKGGWFSDRVFTAEKEEKLELKATPPLNQRH
jgi:hypothetical protein